MDRTAQWEETWAPGPDEPRSGHLAGYEPREESLSLFELLRTVRENTLAILPARAYRERVVRAKSWLYDILYLNDPDGLRQVLSANAANYGKAPMQQRALKPVLGNGILTAEGEDWAWQRRVLQPAFHGRRLSALAPLMAGVVNERLAAWRAQGPGAAIDLHEEMMDLTLDILCHSLFAKLDVDYRALGQGVTDYLDIFVRPDLVDILDLPAWIPREKTVRVRPVLRRINDIVEGIIAARHADPNPPDDFLSLMIRARDQETGRSMSDEDLKSNLITFLAAGHETTAVALTWAFYVLSEYPSLAERIRAEADAVFGAGEEAGDMVSKLPFTRQVLEETMRLYPPVPTFDRVALGPDEVAGETIRKGTVVIVSPFALHRHETLWDEPERFDPARFAPEAVKARHRFAYIPFNAGPRSCIGSGFAMMEGTLVLAMIARAFRLDPVSGHDIVPVGLVSLRPKGGMPMTLSPRA